MRLATLTSTLFVLAVLILTSFAQPDQKGNKPKVTYQVGSAKVVVWENQSPQGGIWKNFQVEKVYQKEGEWATTNSFNQAELLELRAALDKAINEEVTITKK